MKDFIFDLQLFNEENAEQPVVQDSVVQEIAKPTDEQVEAPVTPQEDFEFALDEKGNLIIRDLSETQPKPAENQEQAVEQQPQYTAEEIAEIGIDKLDPNRLPPELIPFYKSMQADYTRKSQDLSAKSKNLDTRIAELNNPTPKPQDEPETKPQEPPVDPDETQRQYYQKVFDTAKANVERVFHAEFDEYNPLHLAALSDEVASIKAFVIQNQNYQRDLQNITSQYTVDPEWKQIETFTQNVLESMPYAQSMQIRQKLQSGDLNFINQFLNTSKSEYYKQKNGVNTAPVVQSVAKPVVVPPKVESAGGGVETAPNKNFDYKSLGKMNNDDLANTFVKLGLTNF